MVKLPVRPHLWKVLSDLYRPINSAARGGTKFRISWSQDGEDLFLADYLPRHGFFVDVGAHHPLRFSVTQLLSERGWTGVNIDASDAHASDFHALRPRDVNVFRPVGLDGTRVFHAFHEGALSTLSESAAAAAERNGWKLLRRQQVRVIGLGKLLRSLIGPRTIDFLSVDVEGMDLEVLKTMDFETFPIPVVMIETGAEAWNLNETETFKFLSGLGYRPVAVFMRSAVFSLPTRKGHKE